jgi:hypothetical protein
MLLLSLVLFSLNTYAQRDSVAYSINSTQKVIGDIINISIYPVPVRENSFTIRSDREISAIKITNIIGQDIYRIKYNDPQFVSKVILDNPKRGMYLVAIMFSDETRVVKKIMIEGIN